MKNLTITIIIIAVYLLSTSCNSLRKDSRQHKTTVIINKMNLIENQKTNFSPNIQFLKEQATGEDSIKLVELEKLLSDNEILRRISKTFNEKLSNKEINDIYRFVQTDAYEKLFNSVDLAEAVSSQFQDINDEIYNIAENIRKQIAKPNDKVELMKVDKEDGFYETVNYDSSIKKEDIKLADKPSLDFKDVLEVKKVFNEYINQAEIRINFTKEGAKKLHILTKKNIGKPIAIVISKQIVSVPIVNSEIKNGEVNISGNLSEEEIDEIVYMLTTEHKNTAD